MSVSREGFGFMPDGTEVYKYVIENMNGCSAHVLTLGATLQSVYAEDAAGELRDVVLGFDTVEDYLTKSNYQGATVGPYCNRIGGASVDINGKHYELTANEKGVTNLHAAGEFSYRVWRATVVDADAVEFDYVSPDGEGGFPGETKAKALFRLDAQNRLHIVYSAVSDRDTYLNMTNHAYFNLNGFGSGDILGHELCLNADAFTPVDALSIPLGGSRDVTGTPFDFRTPQAIGARIDCADEQLEMTGGYDHNFCIAGWDGTLRQCASAKGDLSGIKMNVYTTLPGVQFYAGNFLHGAEGKHGVPMTKRTGFCLETQYYPDTPHRPEFPSCLFSAGEAYSAETVFEFSK
ncbi:MAG: galactose mutarotase [Clostridia bacterium]|nr:galactose mutarotase [Clostridia bacterium]